MAVMPDCECSLVSHESAVPSVDFCYNELAQGYEWMCIDCSEEFTPLGKSKFTSGMATGYSKLTDKYSYTASGDAQLPLNTGGSVGGARTPLYTPRGCKHHLAPFHWGIAGKSYNVFLSASSDTASPEQGPLPTACLYLADAWIRPGSILANFGQWRHAEEPYVVYCEWPDFKTIEPDVVQQLTRYAVDALDKGHRLEIGCMGGHGRTGTMLALLMVATGFPANDAIQKIRKDYCSKAIETKPQEEMIRKFDKEKGE